ncbi:MAG TPA: CVNH domain-containing protein [Verrucomicrobiae bacterium]|nr:CVNH domain-containing protein [Verrucomicrobiae bacterium]
MRYLTLSGVLIFLAALALPAPAAAQGPGGSYQQTCRDIGVRGSTLYAECRDVNGGWHRTEMSDYDRCGADIQNNNGNLECANGGYRGGYGRDRDRDHDRDRDRDRDHDHDQYGNNGYGPRGSYSQTCQNITVNGNQLRASCQKKNGKYKNTSLNNYQYCRGDIQNDNGKLRCR